MVCNDVLRAMANDWIKRSRDLANTTESQASTLVGCAEELLDLVKEAELANRGYEEIGDMR